NGVLQADMIVGELLTTLQRKGYLKDALVVITADHGESLGEHGLFTHANSVREEVLHVPLLFVSYGDQPQVADGGFATPSQIDIAPTILDAMSLRMPASWMGHRLDGPQDTRFSTFEEHAFAGLIDRRDPSHILKYWTDRHTGAEHVFD